MIRFRFVDDVRKTYSVKRLCDVLKINRSSDYKWKKSAPTRNNRLLSDAVLGAKIKSIFAKKRGCYGANASLPSSMMILAILRSTINESPE